MHIKKVFMNSSKNKISSWIHVLQTGHKQGKVLFEQYPVNLLFSWSVWFLFKKNQQELPLSSHYSNCSPEMVQYVPAIVSNQQPNPRWQYSSGRAHPTMKGSQCPWIHFQCSLYLLLIEGAQRRCPLSLTHLFFLHTLLSSSPLMRSHSSTNFYFHVLTAAAFFCPPFLGSSSIGHLWAAWFTFPS